MNGHISFRCPVCDARLRASVRYLGRSCPCPKCGKEIIVRYSIVDEQTPAMVLDDGFSDSEELMS